MISNKDASPYHLYAWKQSVETAYGHKGYYLIAICDNENNSIPKVVGVLPLIHMKKPFGRGALISLPFCDIAGLLYDNDDIEQLLFAEAFSLGREIGVNNFEIRSSKSVIGFKSDTSHVEMQSHKVRMFLDLPDCSEKLLKSFKSKLRSQIKKPEKEGLRFEWGDTNKLKDFYKVTSMNMKDLGSPVHSRLWFISIMKFYADKARMGLVYLGQQLIGCGVILIMDNTVTIPWASTLRKFNHLSPNMMLYWNFLAFASDSGFSRFDFGRSSPGEGTYKFKAQWGAQPEPLHWHNISMKKTKAMEKCSVPKTHNIKREIASTLWSKLPLCIANTVGSRIRKYISL
ncbi:MAG: peptidoglycan bridge formation glycyltransferase FemA/FemB family protein [Candidatus Brocadiaceae bacterium]|nr:peptidoglycan bridge formation glycyltransferase FemA/FemB family protein [Candidatus Brocadiaceae bacterium]